MNHHKKSIFISLGAALYFTLISLPDWLPIIQNVGIQFTGYLTTIILELSGKNPDFNLKNMTIVYLDNHPSVKLIFSCVGWKTISIFLSAQFLLALSPTFTFRKTLMWLGIFTICNALRISILALIQVANPALFHLFHAHVFYLLEYLLLLWGVFWAWGLPKKDLKALILSGKQ